MQQAVDDPLLVADDGRVRTLTLNRPSALNALNAAVFDRLETALDEIEGDTSIRVAVIRGSGTRAFCAGADLDELSGAGAEAAATILSRGQRMFTRIERLSIPVIAAIRGYALGGGFELALACHLRLASESAKLGLPEVGIGLIPGYGGIHRLIAAVGRAPAFAVMLADRRLDACSAAKLGLLAAGPIPEEELDDAVTALADDLVQKSRSATALILSAARSGIADEQTLALDTALAAIAVSSADGTEGIAAFREKRTPRFT